jgi:uncharacterized membrane protein
MFSFLILSTIIPLVLFIGLFFAFNPYFTRPELIFGVRFMDYQNFVPVINGMKKRNVIYDLLISVLFLVLTLILLVYTSAIIAVLFPVAEIIPLTLVYFHFRGSTKELKSSVGEENNKNSTVSAYISKSSMNVSAVWYALPWIELIIFIIIGILHYPAIPNRFATHFGLNGKPNEYETKSIFSVFSLLVFTAIPLTVLLEGISYAINRTRSGSNNAQPRKSSIQMKGFNARMVKLLVGINMIILATLFLSSLIIWNVISSSYVAILTLPVILILPLVFWFAASSGQTGWKMYRNLEETPDKGNTVDDDKEWAGGLVYHNKEDSKILVPKRYGVGYTFNFSNKWSWLILIIIIGVPVTLTVLLILLR